MRCNCRAMTTEESLITTDVHGGTVKEFYDSAASYTIFLGHHFGRLHQRYATSLAIFNMSIFLAHQSDKTFL